MLRLVLVSSSLCFDPTYSDIFWGILIAANVVKKEWNLSESSLYLSNMQWLAQWSSLSWPSCMQPFLSEQSQPLSLWFRLFVTKQWIYVISFEIFSVSLISVGHSWDHRTKLVIFWFLILNSSPKCLQRACIQSSYLSVDDTRDLAFSSNLDRRNCFVAPSLMHWMLT